MEDLIKKTEGLIVELGKSYKALQFYPSDHPALVSTIKKTIGYINQAAVNGKPVGFTILRTGFEIDGKPVSPQSKAFAQFANEFFQRHISKIFFTKDISDNEMTDFLELLSRDPKEIRSGGGIEREIVEKGIKKIWVNETDYKKMLETSKKQKVEEDQADEEGGEAGDDIYNADDPTFASLLDRPKDKEELLAEVFEDINEDEEEKTALADLKEVFVSNKELYELLKGLIKIKNEQEFEEALNKMANICHHLKNAKKYDILLKVALFLSSISSAPRPPFFRYKELLISKIREINTYEIIALAAEYSNADPDKSKYVTYFSNIGSTCISTLFEYIGQKKDINSRYNISNIISSFGLESFDQVSHWIGDARWQVVCAAVNVIGNVAHESGLKMLLPLMESDDIRIQREVIKALGNIRTIESLELLTYISESGDKNLLKQAIVSLGKLQFEQSIPYLIKLTKKGFFKKNDIDVRKSAVTALGHTGSIKAIPALLNILKDISFFGKDENDELRIMAVKSIASIGGEEAIKALEIGRNSHNQLIKNTCKSMLEKVVDELPEEEV